MKSSSITLDQTLYTILVKEGRKQFTVPELRDRYAQTLVGKEFELPKLRIHVYEEVRKMIRVGWVRPNEERKKRNQLFHLHKKPRGLEVNLDEKEFPEKHPRKDNSPVGGPEEKTAHPSSSTLESRDEYSVASHAGKLRDMLKEVKLDFLTQMGQAECFGELIKEAPSLKAVLEPEFIASRDASSRLLGHVQALEVALQKVEP